MKVIPEHRLKEAPFVRELRQDHDYYHKKYEEYKALFEVHTKEIEELKASRRIYREQILTEEVSRRKVLETELKKLEGDLTRIRGHRDQISQNLDLRNAKDEVEFQQIPQIRILANERKDRIKCLESEVLRIKMEAAANNGYGLLVGYIGENVSGNYIKDLESRLRCDFNVYFVFFYF